MQGGRDEPDVHGDLRGATDPHELPVLQEPKELGLHGERHVADLVQEQRPARGRFDLPEHALAGAGERPAFVAEELALEESLGIAAQLMGTKGPV